jgi:hypothetical protein
LKEGGEFYQNKKYLGMRNKKFYFFPSAYGITEDSQGLEII